ncbi:hypothetical protein AB0I28_33760 [Phytomonospora sp. NPDC050363]|uniref:hypothetical protein n=1 Tax=Phytomonospora sp. NPDC050363 TaxID=3155642 RepID=UPI0034043649
MGGNVEDYVPPYEGVDHKTLWEQLNKPAGDPEQVDGLAAHWSNPIKSTLDDFVFDLDRDLTDLMHYWSVKSAGGKEFKRRMDLVVRYADELSGHVGVIKENLDAWSAALRTAQSNAPDPADTDDNGRAVAGAAIGTAVAGPVGGLIGGLVGHSQDEEQKKEAQGNMVRVVAALALEYDTAKKIEAPPPFPPNDLPDSTAPDGTDLRAPDGTSVPSAEPFQPKPDSHVPTYMSTGTPTGLNDPANVTGNGDPSGLLGAGGGTFTGISAGTTGSLGLAGGGGALASGGGGGAGLFGGLGAAGTGAGAGMGRGMPGGSGNPGAGRGGPNTSGLASAKPGAGGKPPTPASLNPSPQGKAPVRSIGGTPTERDGDDNAVYETWLTEDDMVWGDDADITPGVLAGGSGSGDGSGRVTGELPSGESESPRG